MPNKTRIQVTIEHPSDWGPVKIKQYLREHLLSTESEIASLVMSPVRFEPIAGDARPDGCWICHLPKGQPPNRCNGHYGNTGSPLLPEHNYIRNSPDTFQIGPKKRIWPHFYVKETEHGGD